MQDTLREDVMLSGNLTLIAGQRNAPFGSVI